MPAQASGGSWDAASPNALVAACSDGRFQEELDTFLYAELGLRQYDRLYVPGGPGGLVPSGIEFTRANQMQKECRFLIEAHGIERVVLVFHGSAPDGIEAATCGDYRRKFPGASGHEIRKRQDADAAEVVRLPIFRNTKVDVYRCEVTGRGEVRFVPMPSPGKHH